MIIKNESYPVMKKKKMVMILVMLMIMVIMMMMMTWMKIMMINEMSR